MRYKLRENEDLGYSVETTPDEHGNYSIDITLPLITTDALALKFSETINVVSNNSQTGTQVDEQRNLAVQAYLNEINS